MKLARGLAAGAVAYLGASVGLYFAALAARSRVGKLKRPQPLAPGSEPVIRVVSACRDGAPCIPGLVQTIEAQDYPRDRFRLSVIADNCSDETAALARSLGVDTYERVNSAVPGKGLALNEFADKRLRHEAFDILVVLDVDGRVEPDFLRRLAAYFTTRPLVVSCATYARNPTGTLYAETGDVIQGLLRFHQEGRAALGVDAVLYGSHGYAMSRDVLERLDFALNSGLVGEDMELRMRSRLAGVPIRYGADLRMYNDVTADFDSHFEQRRRWNAIYFELIAKYAPLLIKRGDWESLFGVLLLPGPGNLFLYSALTTVGLSAASVPFRRARPLAAASAGVLFLHVSYVLLALRRLRVRLGAKELRGIVSHVVVKFLALAEGPRHVRVKDWASAPHPGDP